MDALRNMYIYSKARSPLLTDSYTILTTMPMPDQDSMKIRSLGVPKYSTRHFDNNNQKQAFKEMKIVL